MKSNIYFALILINLKQLLSRFISPTNLLGAQVIMIDKIPKIIVIDEDEEFVLAVLAVLMINLEYFKNNK